MKITLLGHCTFLIECAGQKVLSDPYFGLWGNPLFFRVRPPAMHREDAPKPDLVLLSHNHWDHIDGPYFRLLGKDMPVLTPYHGQTFTRLMGAKITIGLKAWQTMRFGELTVTTVPAVHLTATLGFVIEGEGKAIYFAGDTFYHDFMHKIGRRFALDAALMPVTTFRIPMTMGEQGALRAVQALRPKRVIPMHLDVQPRLPLLRSNHSVAGFKQRVLAAGLDTQVVELTNGHSLEI